ncbi:hypothetical protein BDV96DRAFT_684725 [Lophiotrema nucula]|uniref:F-box domain-containing protein n=1 Tax=Lophiotrema nucula TaxID=690887 RepID=A0A6A5ZIP6_9PLEO|nr:hypothetical protein BDV96DRAFT_684725 [Lophiotrema nucula]
MPKVPWGYSPSSAVLDRFLKGRKPGSSILPALPAELIQQIAACLPVYALRNLRLTSKEIEAKTLWYFAKAYFRSMQFMHSRYALEALVAVSESRMGQYVQTLAFGPASNDQGSVVFCQGKPLPARRRTELEDNMWSYAESNRYMRLSGQDANMIDTALKNLRGVTVLKFLEDCNCSQNHISFGGRYLDEKVGGGRARFQKTTLDVNQSMARVFSIVLHAAQDAKLGIDDIDASITYMYVYRETSPSLPIGPFQQSPLTVLHFRNETAYLESTLSGYSQCPLVFPTPCTTPLSMVPGFSNLKGLRLCVGYHSYFWSGPHSNRFLKGLKLFLNSAPNLEVLGLVFSTIAGGGGSIWSLLSALSSSGALHGLDSFELEGLWINSNQLFSVLRPLQGTLKGLELLNIKLTDNKWVGLLIWLRDNMRQLREIDIDNPDVRTELPRWVCYAGSDMKGFLDDKIDKWSGVEMFSDEDSYDSGSD